MEHPIVKKCSARDRCSLWRWLLGQRAPMAHAMLFQGPALAGCELTTGDAGFSCRGCWHHYGFSAAFWKKTPPFTFCLCITSVSALICAGVCGEDGSASARRLAGWKPAAVGSVTPFRGSVLPYYLCAHPFSYETSSKCFYHKLGYIFQYKWSI